MDIDVNVASRSFSTQGPRSTFLAASKLDYTFLQGKTLVLALVLVLVLVLVLALARATAADSGTAGCSRTGSHVSLHCAHNTRLLSQPPRPLAHRYGVIRKLGC